MVWYGYIKFSLVQPEKFDVRRVPNVLEFSHFRILENGYFSFPKEYGIVFSETDLEILEPRASGHPEIGRNRIKLFEQPD